MSDCSTRAWMRPGMPETKWKPLGDGIVNLPAEDEPHMIELSTSKDRDKFFPFALDCDEHVTVLKIDGRKCRLPREVDWDDRCATE